MAKIPLCVSLVPLERDQTNGMAVAGRTSRRRSLRPLLPREPQSRTASPYPVDADRGRSSDFWARPMIGLLLHAASQTPFDGAQCQWHFRSQLPLRGSSGIAPDSLLGLAFGPDTAMNHKILCFRDSVNDIATDLMACYYIQYPPFRSSSNERSRHLSSCCCRVVLAHL